MPEGTELGRMKSKKIEWNLASEIRDFIPTVSKFNPDQSRGSSALIRRNQSVVDTSGNIPRGGDGQETEEGDFVGSVVVTVLAARGLPVKEVSSSLNMGGPFALVLPKIFVQVEHSSLYLSFPCTPSTASPIPLTFSETVIPCVVDKCGPFFCVNAGLQVGGAASLPGSCVPGGLSVSRHELHQGR
jgi:hypothetical protein